MLRVYEASGEGEHLSTKFESSARFVVQSLFSVKVFKVAITRRLHPPLDKEIHERPVAGGLGCRSRRVDNDVRRKFGFRRQSVVVVGIGGQSNNVEALTKTTYC